MSVLLGLLSYGLFFTHFTQCWGPTVLDSDLSETFVCWKHRGAIWPSLAFIKVSGLPMQSWFLHKERQLANLIKPSYWIHGAPWIIRRINSSYDIIKWSSWTEVIISRFGGGGRGGVFKKTTRYSSLGRRYKEENKYRRIQFCSVKTPSLTSS